MLISKPKYEFTWLDTKFAELYDMYSNHTDELFKIEFSKEMLTGEFGNYKGIQVYQMLMIYISLKLNRTVIDDALIDECLSCKGIDWYKVIHLFGFYNELGDKTSGVVERLPRDKNYKEQLDIDKLLNNKNKLICEIHCHDTKSRI